MLLTIGMIVKNEEKYLEQCLNGIKPILEQVDSELIIADTGSTDRTVEIAKKFTDNVFYFEWIKDFSAARNSTLEKAKGEWFMYVDGDEVFEGCDEIISFFNSGEYKKYNSASYIQRNLNSTGDESGTVRYSDFRAARMTKLLPHTKFVNSLHENLNTYGKPEKLFHDYVIHYGYNNAKSTEASKNKFKRNSEILLKHLENNERSGMLYLQLYETFYVEEPEKAFQYLEEGIEYCKNNNSKVLIPLLGKKAVRLYEKEEYEKAVRFYDEYFRFTEKMRSGSLATDMEVVSAKALSLSKLGRHEEALESYKIFFGLFGYFEKEENMTDDGLLTSRIIAEPFNYTAIIVRFMDSSIKSEKLQEAKEYILSLPFEKYLLDNCQTEDLVRIGAELFRRTDYNGISDFYGKLDEYGKDKLRKSLFSQIFRAEEPHIILGFFEKEADCKEFTEPSEIVCRISEARKKRDYKACISELKTLLEKYPELASVVSEYRKEIIAEYEALQPKNEMERLSAMIKENIRRYIASGDKETAGKTLAEYEKLNPSDPEIEEIKKML